MRWIGVGVGGGVRIPLSRIHLARWDSGEQKYRLEDKDGGVLGLVSVEDWEGAEEEIIPAGAGTFAKVFWCDRHSGKRPEMGGVVVCDALVVGWRLVCGEVWPLLAQDVTEKDDWVGFLAPDGGVTLQDATHFSSLELAMRAFLRSEQHRWDDEEREKSEVK